MLTWLGLVGQLTAEFGTYLLKKVKEEGEEK
jgi:hypothetical protein